ncbi:MAG: thiamine pyrophosphate-dependent enzyme [Cocleimonas sp.]
MTKRLQSCKKGGGAISKNSIFADGNDAIAWAAQDAGVAYVSHYPGSPVNRVLDVLEQDKHQYNYKINNALSEHIAALATMGASLCGARSLLVMKHVGLNIAADPLNYSAVIKITGGMVVVVGTDPGARTSTGEEDVHWYAPQFNLPLLEPVDVAGVYDAVKQAFVISEDVQLPVLVFVPGRIAYQSSRITRHQKEIKKANFSFSKDPENLINVGARAVRNHRDHILRLQMFQKNNAISQTLYNPKATFGMITRGATHTICCEVIESLGLQDKVELLNIQLIHPLNIEPFLKFASNKKRVIIIEDQDGFLETMIKREAFGKVSCQVNGKDIFPVWGEINDQQVRDFLTDKFDCKKNKPRLNLTLDCPERAGTFCEGCPHRPAFFAIDKALEEIQKKQGEVGIIGGDIGCSSLPPHRTDWLLCMNAGIGMSQGIAHLLPEQPLVSTGGEGSFFHGGLISLQSAVENNINLTHIIFDNRSVAMTGHQDSPTTSGKTDLGKLLDSIGVKHIFEADPFLAIEMKSIIRKATSLKGVKVIWVRGDCALQPSEESLRRLKERSLFLHNDKCEGCTLCYSDLQCPAIVKDQKTSLLSIQMEQCRRCAACIDICPSGAIEISDKKLPI